MIEIIWNSLKQQKKKSFLLLIQFFVGFFALFYAVSMIENMLQYKEQIISLAPENTLQMINYEDYDEELENGTIEKYQKCMKELKEQKEINKIALFESRSYEVGENLEEIKGMVMYFDTLAMSNFQLEQGSIEHLENYKGEAIIPVLVTEEMAKTYPYNSEFKARELSENHDKKVITYKVEGVISSKMKYWRGNTIPIADSVRECSGMWFILPTIQLCRSLEAYNYNTLILPGTEAEEEIIKNKVCEIYEKNELYSESYTIKDQVNEFYKGQKFFLFTIGSFSIILLFLSVLGCIGTLLASIIQRKEEFGIYTTLGFTRKHLARLVFGEIFFLFVSAFVLAALGCSGMLYCMETVTGTTMNIRIITIGFAVMILCVICSAIMPLWRINVLQPIELVEGRE